MVEDLAEEIFYVGEKVYVCSAHWGVQWAKQKFGVGYKSHFLIGTVEKVATGGKGKLSYVVSFHYDNSKYTWKASEMVNVLRGEISGDETHYREGFVVICGGKVEKTTMAEIVKKSPLDAATGALMVLGEHEKEGMLT